MGSTTAGDTLREMVQGFNAMQAQLGLLPPQTGQMPMGVGLNQPPPMPQIMSPGQISQQAHDNQMFAMQRTMQAAQATRYIPPPSAPSMGYGAGQGATWGGTMSALGAQQFNPYVANAMNGGGGMMPSPIFNTAPNYGMYRPGGGRMGMPSTVYNPYTSPAFNTPVGFSNAGIHQQQMHSSAALMGGVQSGFELGGSILGGALGSIFGPVGSLAGGYLGSKVGGFMGGMATDPIVGDISRARQLQHMTSPFMVSGPNMNMLTGQGMDRQSAMQSALGLRHLTRDHDFVRQTGFNNADMSRLTGLAGEQGLLDTARNPEDMVRKMKDVALSVKALIQITHDPDVRAAMKDLGKLRQLGFEGIGGQMGAVSNRATFSRMAGMTHSAMDSQYGMPGAMMAQSLGLSGSTGYTMGMASGGVANVAVSSGAFSDLQLARAGGRQGVAQTNMMAALGAANQDLYMAASLRRNSAGKLDIDTDAYSRAQSMNISDVARSAAQNLNHIGASGISELATRKQEFKDRLAGSQSPLQQQLNIAKQAMAMQRETGLTFGGALSVMVGSTEQGRGMSSEQREQVARTLELQFTSREFYDGLHKQLQVERRSVLDRARSGRARNRTPGLITRAGYGLADFAGGASDAITSPFRAMGEHFDEVSEDNEMASRGEHMVRHNSMLLARSTQDKARMVQAMRGDDIFGGASGEAGLSGGIFGNSIGNTANYFGNMFGLNRANDANLKGRFAAMTRGDIMGFSWGSAGEDNARTRGAIQSAHAISRARDLSAQSSISLMGGLQGQGSAAIGGNFNAADFIRRVSVRVDGKIQKAGVFSNAGAMMPEHVASAAQEELANLSPRDKAAAQQFLSSNMGNIHTAVAQNLLNFGGKQTQEVLGQTQEIATLTGALGGNLSKDKIEKMVNSRLESLTGGSVGEHFKQLLMDQDPAAIAYAALQKTAFQGGASGEKARQAITALEAKYSKDPQSLEKIKAAAAAISRGADDKTGKTLASLGGKGSNDLAGDIAQAQQFVHAGRGRTAYESELTKLSDKLPMLRGMEGRDPTDVLDKLSTQGSEEDLRKLTPAQRKLVESYRKGDNKQRSSIAKEFMAGLAMQASPEVNELVSMSGHEEGMGKLEKDQASLAKLRDKLGDGKADIADKVFAEAVDVFAEAAKTLKEAADQQALNNANPFGGR